MIPILILDGPPKSGKTTLAEALQLNFSPLLYLDCDKLVDQFQGFTFGLDSKLLPSFVQGYTGAIASFARAGVPLVADAIITEEKWLEDLRKALSGCKWYFIGLKAPLEVLQKRAREAGEPFQGDKEFSAPWKTYDLLLDTDKYRPSECVEQIKKLLI